MLTLPVLVAGCLLIASLPYWLPSAVLALRMRIFTRINGKEGLPIPGKLVDASKFKQLYSHPAANGRSRGAALSDLFWYWLSPGPHIHQEHIEPGEKYEEVARTTRRILAVPRGLAESLVVRSLTKVLGEWDFRRAKLVRLRDLMMPVWAEFYYALVFREPCARAARELIVGNANDVATALKCCGLRHMDKRHRLTRFLTAKLSVGDPSCAPPHHLSIEEQALYLQGTFFNTAVVQTSEAMVHLLMVLAQQQDAQQKLASKLDEPRYLDWVIDETLRLYPLFGISHRIATADIALDEKNTLHKGTVLCFNHPEYHRSGFAEPDAFRPDRWESLAARDANYVPFGVAANRPCPASGLAPITMRAALREILTRFTFYSSAAHTRSIPNRGPCLMVPRDAGCPVWQREALLLFLRLRDRWEDVWRSVVQLVLGTYMVLDARRLRLCQSYFEAEDKPPAAPSQISTNQCPHLFAEKGNN